jgi:hypothetical protein
MPRNVSISRNDALRRSAAIRAHLIAYFNRIGKGEVRTLAKIRDDLQDQMNEAGVTGTPPIENQLGHLVKIGNLVMIKKPHGTPNLYSLRTTMPTVQQAAPIAEAAQARPYPEQQTHVQLEVVKTTGTVRLGLNKMVIEIRVVDR